MKEANSKDSETIFKINDFFRMNEMPNYRRSFRLSDTLVNWCSQENGIEDVLMTIHILFGTD